jgi:hypothetical protein
MPQAQHNQSFSFPGYAFNSQEAAVSFDNTVAHEITLPALVAAQTGTMTTKTDADTGEIALSTGHTIETGDVVDVYFPAGVRYGMDATVSTNDVTVDGGAGEDLPVATTACTVVKVTEINPLNLDGDNAEIVGIFYRNSSDTGALAHIDLQDSGSASIEAIDLVHETANGGLSNITNISGGDTNVFTGNPITKGFASHDSTTAATLYVLAGIDSTP